MGKRPPSRALLDEVLAAIDALPICAGYLEDDEQPDRMKIYGLCEHAPPRLTVNEAVCMVETLAHEALHAIRPTWQERTVDVRARNLFFQLTSEEIQRVYRQYRRRARRARKRII